MKSILEILTDIRPEVDFSVGRDFIKDGLLDSFDIVTLVAELEASRSIRIDGTDILPENFSSIAAIERLAEKGFRNN